MDTLKVDKPFHPHPLTPMRMDNEECASCRYVFSDLVDGYKCDLCNMTFHVNCKDPCITHPSHSLHPLKLLNGEPPAYTDGKCRLCGENLANLLDPFYHCSACNFSLDWKCIRRPPAQYLHDQNIHEHQLTLLPKSISFTCTICGLHGDRSPYVCLPCDFIIHNKCARQQFRSLDCTGYPWVININRHDHRVYRTSLIGVVDSVCGICREKMDWSCGGYACKRCPSSVFHTLCATREDVWDGKEMKDEPEEDEDVPPFKVIDENTIQHVSHPKEEHSLRLDKSGIFIEERFCQACAYPIYHQSFYSCISCSFILHETCAYLPLRQRHAVSRQRSKYIYQTDLFRCSACQLYSSGFKYEGEYKDIKFDVRCASVTDPFVHKSHPHPLYYTSPEGVCSVCNSWAKHVLRCVEENCGYVMDYKCALLPYEVKHRVDQHFLSLCYGEEKEEASGKYWCDICEKQTDPKKWFYTSKDGELTLHTECVLGDIRGLKPGFKHVISDSHHKNYIMVVRNNSMSRPFCEQCKSRCITPVFIRDSCQTSELIFCSGYCWDDYYAEIRLLNILNF